VGRKRLRGRVSFRPGRRGFAPISGAQEAVELEADLKGLYQEDPSELMGVSRAAFGRILEGARRKLAEALVGGKALRLKEEVQRPAQEGIPRRGCRRGKALDRR